MLGPIESSSPRILLFGQSNPRSAVSIWEEQEPQRTFGPVAYSLQTSLAERHRDQQQSSAEKKEIRRWRQKVQCPTAQTD